MRKVIYAALVMVMLTGAAFANTPGKHSVTLSWLETDPTVVSYNIYKGTTAGVCGTGGSVTPYVMFWPTKNYVDTSVVAGTQYFYATSGVNAAGGESACSNEVQPTVPSTPGSPTGMQAVAN